jgi:hypothetical protein
MDFSFFFFHGLCLEKNSQGGGGITLLPFLLFWFVLWRNSCIYIQTLRMIVFLPFWSSPGEFFFSFCRLSVSLIRMGLWICKILSFSLSLCSFLDGRDVTRLGDCDVMGFCNIIRAW